MKIEVKAEEKKVSTDNWAYGAIYPMDMATGQIKPRDFSDVSAWLFDYYASKFGESDYHTEKYWLEKQVKEIVALASQEIENQTEYGLYKHILEAPDGDVVLVFYDEDKLNYSQVEKAVFG